MDDVSRANSVVMVCARPDCAEAENRIDGYCSVYCRDIHELEQEAEPLRNLAAWLVGMDDPTDASGMTDRKTVTLTRIIDRAREALGVR